MAQKRSNKTGKKSISTKRIARLSALKQPFRDLVKEIQVELDKACLPFRVFETLRTSKRQDLLYGRGASGTRKSRHLVGYACDFVIYENGGWSWDLDEYLDDYQELGRIIKAMSNKHLVWGGKWRRRDYVHVEYRE